MPSSACGRGWPEPKDEQLRDELIQRFEFTYELSHKMLWRYRRETAASPDVTERLSFAELIRRGNAGGLLREEWPVWRRFREMSSRSSHTYDPKVAEEVVAAIPEFLAEAAYLHRELGRRLA